MLKKIILFFLLFSSFYLFAETDTKQKKSFENWAIVLDIKKSTLEIINSKGKTMILKELLDKDTSSDKKMEKPLSLEEINKKKRTSEDYVLMESKQITVIHGSMEDLEIIYNSLNSVIDCENLNLHKMGYNTAAAKSINLNSETGIIDYLDLIICGELNWDEE